jgi:hypothetical protein
MALGEVISRLSVQLSLDSAAFTKGSATAAKQTKDLGDRMEAMGHKVGTAIKGVAAAGVAMAGAWAVDQVKQMATVGLELASSLGEQAQQMGVTTSALQQYRYMATQVGIEQEEMDKGLTTLTKRLGLMSTATTEQNSELERFGFTTAEIAKLSKMTAEQALPVLADKYASLTSITEKTALAQEFFGGKLGPKFNTLLAEGSVGIDKLTNAYKALGIELSPEQIAKADEAMDKMSQLQTAIAAKQAQIATDNVEGVMKGIEAWEKFKLKMLEVAGSTAEAAKDYEGFFTSLETMLTDFDKYNADQAAKSSAYWRGWGTIIKQTVDGVIAAFNSIPSAVSNMVSQIATVITGRLNAIWDGALARIEIVKKAFWGLYDAVVGHSYIPDMVDGIAAQMNRLDAVMVTPAKDAAEKTKEVFRQLAQDTASLLDRLFPESTAANKYRSDSKTIDDAQKAGMITAAQAEEARARLNREGKGSGTEAIEAVIGKEMGDVPSIAAPIFTTMDKFGNILVSTKEKAEIATVAIAESFKDMAEKTLSSLQTLTNAIKGGGFLDILGAVIGVGLQLGGMGAFGKSAQTRINTPRYANGTNFARGGLSLVGERGPELVNLPRGSKVTPNNRLGGNVYNINGVITTDEFWGIIQKGNANAAVGGANLAGMSMARSRKWALG